MTLDLRPGHHHIPLDKSSILKTPFNSPFQCEYVKVPFGLAQMPAYFQELMTGILKDFNFTIAYLDDIIIFSRTLEEHLSHIRKVFEKLCSAKLSINETQQMSFLFQGNPILRAYSDHKRNSPTTIESSSYIADAATHHLQTGMSISWFGQLLQEVYQQFCPSCKTTNTSYQTGQV